MSYFNSGQELPSSYTLTIGPSGFEQPQCDWLNTSVSIDFNDFLCELTKVVRVTRAGKREGDKAEEQDSNDSKWKVDQRSFHNRRTTTTKHGYDWLSFQINIKEQEAMLLEAIAKLDILKLSTYLTYDVAIEQYNPAPLLKVWSQSKPQCY